MDQKKWPVPALVIIAWGLLVSVAGGGRGIMTPALPDLLSGVIGLVIFYNFFKLKPWARTGLIILLSFNIFALFVFMLVGVPLVYCLVSMLVCAGMIYYFSRPKIRELFNK